MKTSFNWNDLFVGLFVFLFGLVGMIAWVCILIIALLVLPLAHADEFYGIVGGGAGYLKTTPINNTWYQDGFAHVSQEHSGAFRIGAGMRLNKYVNMEVDYRLLGTYSSTFLGVGDTPGMPGNYNPVTSRCNGACDPTASGYQAGKTDGIGLSMVAAPPWRVAPFVRAGVFYHRTVFTSAQRWASDDPHTQVMREFNHDGSAAFVNNGPGMMLGAGIRFGPYAELEYTAYPNVGGVIAPWKDAATVMLTARIPF